MNPTSRHPDVPILLVRTARDVPGYTVTQPLGILYLGAVLREHGYRNVRLLDMRPERMATAQVMQDMRRFRPRLLGLSSLSYEAETVAELVEATRRFDPSIHIALGGPFPSSMKEKTFELAAADSICVGEGERIVLRLADGVAAGELPPGDGAADIPGLLFRGRPASDSARDLSYIEDLDTLPLPAWDLLDLTKYFGITNFNYFLRHPNYMSVMTTRGCPYRCAYCHNVHGKTFRKRSVEHVLREIHALVRDHGISEIHFIDDSFNLDLPRAKTIFDELAKLRPRISIAFPNGLRCDRIDEEFLVKARAAGTYKINYAVETASPRLQKKIRKNLDLEKVREMIRIGDRLDILGHGFFMLGFPTETEDEMRATIDYALSSRLHTANFFVVQPFEGTDIHQMFRERHPEMVNDAGQFDYYRANFEIYEIPRSRLQRLVQEAHLRFFLAPWRVARLVRLVPRPFDLLRGAVRLAYRGVLGKG
ncbi:MAG: B12-binding domain-containing radical SAM protein [Deltaproteobacteria bacterium]|nr:B12-binding domain-containing radical SAM protein [Deltaproteobacteria bacterium]